jgi:hypothetical protein
MNTIEVDKPLRNSIDDNDTTAQEFVFRDTGFNPQLHVLGERLGGLRGTSFVDDISSTDP